jgi:hypothetical protein
MATHQVPFQKRKKKERKKTSCSFSKKKKKERNKKDHVGTSNSWHFGVH